MTSQFPRSTRVELITGIWVRYLPSVRWRWLVIGHDLFCVFISVNKNAKNTKANIQLSSPKKTCSVKNLFFLAEPMWGIPRRQDGPAEIANENTGFALSYLLADSAIKYREILHTSTLFSQFLIFLFRDCTTVMKPTASDVEAPSIVCCSISVRAWEGIKTSYKYSLSYFNKSEKDIVHLKWGKNTNTMHVFTFRVNNNKIHMTKKKTQRN